MRTCHCLLFFLLTFGCFAQGGISKEFLDKRDDWNEGFILLADGSELRGFVRYNDLAGLISFQNDTESVSYTPQKVLSFEFYDKMQEITRIFYSIHFEDAITNVSKPFFFEALKEFKTFAVLSKTDPMEVEHKKRSTGSAGLQGVSSPGFEYVKTKITQREIIYFMSSEGGIKPYLEIIDKDVHALWNASNTKNKFVNEKLFRQYTGSVYGELEIFAHDNDLSFKRKEDLIKILDYYHQLITN